MRLLETLKPYIGRDPFLFYRQAAVVEKQRCRCDASYAQRDASRCVLLQLRRRVGGGLRALFCASRDAASDDLTDALIS